MDHFEINLVGDEGVIASQKTGKDTSFAAGVEEAGTYYVLVHSSDSYRYNGEEYSLTATSTAGDTSSFETEDNGSFTIADIMLANEIMQGNITNIYDWDFFKFSASSSGVITINLDTPTDMPNMDYFFLGVYNSNGEIIAAQNSGRIFLYLQEYLPQALLYSFN